MSSRGHLLPVAALGAASVVGGVVSLVGASALGVGNKTTTVRQIQPALGGNSPASFETASPGRAQTINEPMKLAAAQAIASVIPEDHLSEDYIVPSVFDKRVVRMVARAVAGAAHETGVARRRKPEERGS